MRLQIRTLIVSLWRCVRPILRLIDTRRRIAILVYHEIDPEVFKSHIDYLQKNYELVSLREVGVAYSSGDFERLPRSSAAITFDDGWKSNYDLLHTIKKRTIPVTIFLNTGIVGTNRRIWNYTLERRGSERELNEQLKLIDNCERKQRLQHINGHTDVTEYETRDMLSTEEIREMASVVDFQSHGEFHPVLTKCSDKELIQEFRDSSARVQALTRGDCFAFAYPYGLSNMRVRDFAKSSGYLLGRGLGIPRHNFENSDPMNLSGVGIDEEWSVDDLEKQLLWTEIRSIV
ncbi:polysaccharide deacetylase family protein [Parahaliea maris]|uniref:polysaccharide deacetylase family protein n=1 Tax=Parahaliea maris TaxID=2716870 RepID=UPI00164F3312|nr:polysaccharide deacetylase family protein [Parahaliea maris]